jgi:hypothetical protein
MKIVRSGDYSEITVTIFKPEKFSEQEFAERVREAELHMDNMKQIIE